MASGISLRASASVPEPAVDSTPFRPAERASPSSSPPKVGSSSTISTTRSPGTMRSRSSANSGGGALAMSSGAAGSRCGSSVLGLRARSLERGPSNGMTSVKVEPLPGMLSTLQLAAEQARDLAADRQAEAGAAIFAAGGAVGLLERFEDQLLLVLGNADAGIGDGNRQRLRGARRRCRCRLLDAEVQRDLALRR